MLEITTIGLLSMRLGGEEVALPASRKTRALIAYLAIAGGAHSRSSLCELLWEVPDDPRAALRWSLSKLRGVLNLEGRELLIADRQSVQLSTEGVTVDFITIRRAAEDAEALPNDLARAWELASRPLLQDCELPNQPEFTIWLEQQRNELTRLRTILARRLVMECDIPLEQKDRWAERWLHEAPFDRLAAQQAVAARRAAGQEAAAKSLADKLRFDFEQAGIAPPDFDAEENVAHLTVAPSFDALRAAAPRQSIRFVQAKDKTSIAWASVGDKDNPPLVKAANWLTHLELDWEAPIWSPLFRELARTFHFVRYDERGCGLSDWDAAIDFESFVNDLELVADASGLERFPLLGISQGAAVSIEFAARYPERVSELILFGGYPSGWRHTATESETREREAVMVLTETGWGSDNPSYRHLFSQTFMPDATSDELAWFDEFQRRTTSAENAVRFLEAFSTIDVRERLKDVKCPTLVVHSHRDQRIPLTVGASMAAEIRDATFAGVDSDNHLLLGREPASQEFVGLVRQFLKR